ncbi:Protein kinase-like domain protein [Moelleriella libera RCEF 2490]|uniref:Protein kinase-like domain protein n=1 Tax=Moelleriella libera RCEF 2490 TaxID=1081109 RepID=A0A166PUC6_9HYPO|nr:Protein kinase-like domain protein [Moelleriella libera RCEF 2490]
MKPEAQLIDINQCFLSSSPPRKMLGTPIDFLAAEVAVGLEAGPTSDVWALGCCIFRLRSGEGPFSSPFDVIAPEDLDSMGHPAKDFSKGKRYEQWWDGEQQSLHHMIERIWDEPKDRTVRTGNLRLAKNWGDRHRPFPSHFSHMVWNPSAIKVDNTYLTGYDDEWECVLKALPKIRKDEATLLYDLLSKILVHEPARRITVKQMLDHPWFHIDEFGHGTRR